MCVLRRYVTKVAMECAQFYPLIFYKLSIALKGIKIIVLLGGS